MPLPGNGGLTMPLYAGVGWCMLLAAGVGVYATFMRLDGNDRYNKSLIGILLILFLVALFVTWSPIDFWKFLPKVLAIAQFSYRLLAQVMWIGALLFAWAVIWIFKKKVDSRHVAIGVLLIGLSSASWLHTNESNLKIVGDVVKKPDLGYGQGDYLTGGNFPITYAGSPLPLLVTGDGWLIFNRSLTLPEKLLVAAPQLKLHLEGMLPRGYLKPPVILTMKVNDSVVAIKRLTTAGSFTWDIPLGKYAQTSPQEGLKLQFLTNKTFSLYLFDPQSSDHRSLAVMIQEAILTGAPPSLSVLTVQKTQMGCKQTGDKTVCTLTVPAKTGLFELPVLYYAKLLNIQVNGHNTGYQPIIHEGFVFAGLKLIPGTYHIVAFFRGLWWANWVSGMAWLSLVILFVWNFLKNSKRIIRTQKKVMNK